MKMRREEMLAFHDALARTCAICERELDEGEQRVILPAYVQERDALVREGMVEQRVVCVACAMSIKQKSKERTRRVRRKDERLVAYLRMLHDRSLI